MKGGTQQVTEMVRCSVDRLMTDASAFCKWFEEAKTADGDVVVINNSFIYRKPLIKTSKNEQYLCLRVKQGEVASKDVCVCKPGDMDSDFKLFRAESANLPPLESLDEAVRTEVKRLGRLIFVLIGELQDLPATVPVNHNLVKKLRFEPSARKNAALEDIGDGNKEVVVRRLTDPESVWDAIKDELTGQVGVDLAVLEKAFAAAFEKLQDEARLELVLPSPTTRNTGESFIARLRKSVSEQRKLYEDALQKWKAGGGSADSHLREIMRIAYNFADDAIKVLQLLVSIADLKGVLLWCTIKEHFDVAEAFSNLPWTRSHKKPSLE
ncbi:MAG: hypothetical protein IRY88_15745, partial [Rubrobacteraceae bacterium]|nr:hypothetical protein [Rubrobacteraceae bacterium]